MKTLFVALAALSPSSAFAHEAGAPHVHPHVDVGLSVAVLVLAVAAVAAVHFIRRS